MLAQGVRERQEVAHVVGGVGELRLRERAAPPVAERLVVEQPNAERGLHEALVAGAGAEPREAGDDLGVDDPRGVASLTKREQQQVGGRRVHDELDRRIGDELGDRTDDTAFLRVDQHDALAGRGLQEAEHRRIGALPPELRVERDATLRADDIGELAHGALALQDLEGNLRFRRAHRGVLPDVSDRAATRRAPNMREMPIFEQSCIVRAPIDEVFAFHLDTRNAARIAPRTMPVLDVRGSFPLAEGDEVEIDVRLWPTAAPADLARRADRVVPPTLVVDRMLAGALSLWTHEHRFTDLGDGTTRLTDHVDYRLPFGVLGGLADRCS